MTNVYRTRSTQRFFKRFFVDWHSAIPITNVEPAHNTTKLLCPNETERVSISLACCKQRIKYTVWKTVMIAESNKERMIVVGVLSV